MAELKRLNVKISADMHDWLKSEAEKRGLTMQAIVIFALENYYKEQMMLPAIDKIDGLVKWRDEVLKVKGGGK